MDKSKTNETYYKDFESTTTLRESLREKECIRQVRKDMYQQRKKHLLDEKKKKEEYKTEKLQNKIAVKNTREELKSKHRLFRLSNFFTKWFYVGLGLILISIINTLTFDNFLLKYNSNSLEILFEIISGLFSTIGIALLVGCIFDFSKNSEAFLTFISKILKDIIVSKTFLSSLTSNDKREALKLILQPSCKQIEQYSNINEYFKKKIDDSMKMFDTNFKTNLILNIEARKDENGKVYCESLLTYVVYKIGDNFEPIKISYEKSNSKTLEAKLIYEDGEMKLPPGDSQLEKKGGITQDSYTFEIPDSLKHYDKLTVRRRMYEPGNDHWINYIWQSLTPYEGIACHLKCFDNLTVKDFMIYDNKAYYQTDKSEDGTTLNITSSQWLEPDTGFFITISDTPLSKNNSNTRTTQDKN